MLGGFRPKGGLWLGVMVSLIAAALLIVGPTLWTAKAAGRGAGDPTGATQLRYNATSGLYALGANSQGTWSPGWTVLPANFDGNAATDFLLYNDSTGQWYRAINNSSGGFSYFPAAAVGQWSAGWTVEVADLNGDNRSDVFLYNAATGAWFQCLFTSATSEFQYTGGTWSPGWDVHSVDFNGDARTDLFIYAPASGAWFKVLSQTNGTFSYTGGQWSPGWEIHDTCDFNGDGRGDLLLYDSQASGSYFQVMSQGDGSFAYSGGQWSPGWDISVGDFNGDGRDDVYLYSPATGGWYQALTTNSFTYTQGQMSPGWAIQSYDFNGDSLADLLLYDPLTGAYYVATSHGAGFSYAPGTWGAGDTVIVPPMSHEFKYGAMLPIAPAPAPGPAPAPVPTPTPPPACNAIVCDPLQGSTVGQQVGGSWNDFGYYVSNDMAGIVYSVSPTITSGYFEYEAIGLRYPSPDNKHKIISMSDGAFSSGDNYRATIELRAAPRYTRMKFITGSTSPGSYIEMDGAIPWNPGNVFKVRLEWGPGKRARFIATDLTSGGEWGIDAPYANGGTYNPGSHVIRVCNPGVGGDHGSVAGISVRNVRIGRF